VSGTPERRVVGRLTGRAGGRTEVAAEGGEVEREQRGREPDAVGVLVAGGQVAKRLADFRFLEAFLDLARWRWKCPTQTVGWWGMSVRMKL
jgi:hypothetical protein